MEFSPYTAILQSQCLFYSFHDCSLFGFHWFNTTLIQIFHLPKLCSQDFKFVISEGSPGQMCERDLADFTLTAHDHDHTPFPSASLHITTHFLPFVPKSLLDYLYWVFGAPYLDYVLSTLLSLALHFVTS